METRVLAHFAKLYPHYSFNKPDVSANLFELTTDFMYNLEADLRDEDILAFYSLINKMIDTGESTIINVVTAGILIKLNSQHYSRIVSKKHLRGRALDIFNALA